MTEPARFPKARPTLKLTRFADFPAEPRKDWLVQGLLGAAETSCIFGAPGSGKSVLATDLAAHVACGWPWFGRRVAAGGVLYVAAERAALVERRLTAFARRNDIPDMPLSVLSGGVDLRTSRAQVLEIIEHAKVVREEAGSLPLIIIDTVSRALAGGDENSPKDMGAFVGNAALIQESTGAHLLLIHHIPADGTQRLRGHGALLGAVDCTIGVEKAGGARTATLDKSNDVPGDVRLGFTLESVTLSTDPNTGEETTAPVVVPGDAPSARAPKARPQLSPANKIALRALHEALAEMGKPAPASNHVPNGTLVVTEAEWRRVAYQRGLSDGGEEAQRKAFFRARQALLAASHIATWGEFVWALRHPADA